MLTLKEKEQQLLSSVALPTLSDWAFLSDDPSENIEVMHKANEILGRVLTNLKSADRKHPDCSNGALRDFVDDVYDPIKALAEQYPDAGLEDSEACETIARFFAINYSPKLYDVLRWGNWPAIVTPRHPVQATQWFEHGQHPAVSKMNGANWEYFPNENDTKYGLLPGNVLVSSGDWILYSDVFKTYAVMKPDQFSLNFDDARHVP